MTTEGPHSPPAAPDRPPGTPAQRLRFVIALAAFGLWVAFLAVLALRADPPKPEPGAELPAPAPATDTDTP